MFSLGYEISKITNPTPSVSDPEDEFFTFNKQLVLNRVTTGNCNSTLCKQSEDIGIISDLRRKTAPLLEDIDSTYAGRKVLRSKLGGLFHDDEEERLLKDQKDDGTIADDILSSSSESQDEVHIDDDLTDSDVENFKKLIDSQSTARRSSESSGKESNKDDISSEPGDEKSQDDISQHFSNIDVTSEIEKGESVKNQKEIWNRLLETRIKLQKLLVTANKLPQSDVWQQVRDKGGEDMAEHLKKGTQSMRTLLNHLVKFQCELIIQTPELNSSTGNCSKSNEEICSNTEDEMEEIIVPDEVSKRGIKRKSRNNDYSEVLDKQLKSLIPYRNSVISKWDEKTRLSTGRMTQKSFAGFNNSALNQIEQIFQDKTRLIRRTQLKRSLYRVLGKPELPELKEDDVSKEIPMSKQDMLLKDTDPEVFDDDDFYRQILKDVIESKSFGMDPSVLRKQMEIQKIRNKMKRKVDTKASKGRKLRYDIHPKLVNFMAPVESNQIPDEARESFLKYLFGGKSVPCS